MDKKTEAQRMKTVEQERRTAPTAVYPVKPDAAGRLFPQPKPGVRH